MFCIPLIVPNLLVGAIILWAFYRVYKSWKTHSNILIGDGLTYTLAFLIFSVATVSLGIVIFVLATHLFNHFFTFC